MLIDLKINKGCADCGINDYRLLDFDHLANKKYTISHMVSGNYSLETVLNEVSKCEVVCSNCHRIRTVTRKLETYARKTQKNKRNSD